MEKIEGFFHEETGDAKARLLLIECAEAALTAGNYAAAASLIHAEAYLEDREYYAIAPWPKSTLPPEWFQEIPRTRCRHHAFSSEREVQA